MKTQAEQKRMAMDSRCSNSAILDPVRKVCKKDYKTLYKTLAPNSLSCYLC